MHRLTQQPKNPHATREDRWSNGSKRTILDKIPPACVLKQRTKAKTINKQQNKENTKTAPFTNEKC
jgi:hypothetical protein